MCPRPGQWSAPRSIVNKARKRLLGAQNFVHPPVAAALLAATLRRAAPRRRASRAVIADRHIAARRAASHCVALPPGTQKQEHHVWQSDTRDAAAAIAAALLRLSACGRLAARALSWPPLPCRSAARVGLWPASSALLCSHRVTAQMKNYAQMQNVFQENVPFHAPPSDELSDVTFAYESGEQLNDRPASSLAGVQRALSFEGARVGADSTSKVRHAATALAAARVWAHR